ncbi:hypothetical protein WR25_05165 [Diploscapter pachys]|uniref:Uncharacterized protein n=1 Tax=Diploscapter pachys TaxID=2018661 RepID=A0A2A2JZN5_9BILA|nr:hypothetical protein WR25_05165 [Diploscapter pachys]
MVISKLMHGARKAIVGQKQIVTHMTRKDLSTVYVKIRVILDLLWKVKLTPQLFVIVWVRSIAHQKSSVRNASARLGHCAPQFSKRVAQLPSGNNELLASPASPIVSYSGCSSSLATPSREEMHLSLKSPEVSDRTEPPATAVNPNEYDAKIMPDFTKLLDESYGSPLYKSYFIIVGGKAEDLKPIITDAIRRNVPVITKNQTLLQKNQTLLQKNQNLLQKNQTLLKKNQTLLQKNQTLLQKNQTLLQKKRMKIKKVKMVKTMKVNRKELSLSHQMKTTYPSIIRLNSRLSRRKN